MLVGAKFCIQGSSCIRSRFLCLICRTSCQGLNWLSYLSLFVEKALVCIAKVCIKEDKNEHVNLKTVIMVIISVILVMGRWEVERSK